MDAGRLRLAGQRILNVLERASLWDVGVQKCVEIAGPDAEVMQLLTPRDITDHSVAAYVFLTNQDGGVLNDSHAANR